MHRADELNAGVCVPIAAQNKLLAVPKRRRDTRVRGDRPFCWRRRQCVKLKFEVWRVENKLNVVERSAGLISLSTYTWRRRRAKHEAEENARREAVSVAKLELLHDALRRLQLMLACRLLQASGVFERRGARLHSQDSDSSASRSRS